MLRCKNVRRVSLIFLLLLLTVGQNGYGEEDLFQTYVMPQGQPDHIILQPSAMESKGGYPALERLPDEAPVRSLVEPLFADSFIRESVKLYVLTQNYLVNTGQLEAVEPAYLLLSSQDGGYARQGFYLKAGSEWLDKTKARYVDLVKRDSRQEDYLGSMTQIFPHEMGHNIYRLLSPGPLETKSITMHYAAVVTDYRTAFDEGFAEHFEIIARENEPNATRKQAIEADQRRIAAVTSEKIAGYDRDYAWPLRLGLYRAALPFWYQQYEHLKRNQAVLDVLIKHPAYIRSGLDAGESVLYRNTAVHFDAERLRNPAAMLATEGVVSSVFAGLLHSELPTRYLPPDFYRSFLRSGAQLDVPVEKLFSPLQNEYMKIFVVLHKYVRPDVTEKSQLLDFVQGYGKEFPAEKARLEQIFQQATGGVTGEPPGSRVGPELWLAARNVDYPVWVFDQYKGITASMYPFNLNAADVHDLMLVEGISRTAAEAITSYRDQHGALQSLDELEQIPGVSLDEAAKLKAAAAYDESEIALAGLGMAAMFAASLQHLLLAGLMWFAGCFAVEYFFRVRYRESGVRRLVLLAVGRLAVFYLLLAAGVFAVMLSGNTLLTYFIGTGIVLTLQVFFLLLRKRRGSIKATLLSSAAFTVIVLYSVV